MFVYLGYQVWHISSPQLNDYSSWFTMESELTFYSKCKTKCQSCQSAFNTLDKGESNWNSEQAINSMVHQITKSAYFFFFKSFKNKTHDNQKTSFL